MPGRRLFGTAGVRSGREGVRGRDYLAVAATPTFAAMALLTTLSGQDHAGLSCTQARLLAPLSGMTAMYLLMAFFHLGPWFRSTR